MSSNGRPLFPFPVPAANVPIVGQTVEIVTCVPVVGIICRCTREGTSLSIAGVHSGMQCNKCKKVYTIGDLHFIRQTMAMHIDVNSTTPEDVDAKVM